MGWSEKFFFCLFVCLVFFFLLFKNRVVFKWSAPCPRLRRAAGGSAGRVASNLWYCMFWAGKRGRRSSAGSLESNVEVSRSPSGWLCVASRPQFSPLVYFFVRFFFAPPSLLRRGRIHPACLARACCPPRRPAPSPLVGAGSVGRVRVCMSRFSLRLTPAPRPLSMVNTRLPHSRHGPAPSLSAPPSDFRAPPSPSLLLPGGSIAVCLQSGRLGIAQPARGRRAGGERSSVWIS